MIKLTILWNFQAQGFSESWYGGQSSLPAADDPAVLNFVQARNDVTSQAVQWLGHRLTDTLNPRATVLYRNPNPAKLSVSPDVPTNAWLFECKAIGGRGTRQIWLRGIPDDYIIWDPASASFKVQGGMRKEMNIFNKALIAGPWGIKTVKPLQTTAKQFHVAQNPQINVGPVGTRLIGAAAGATAGGPLLVSGFKKPLNKLNGNYVWSSGYFIDTADVVILGKTFSAAQYATYTGSGNVRVPEYEVKLCTTPQPVAPRERRIGKAFFVPAGRRRR